MTAKGIITGNDAADRILRGEVPLSAKALRRVIVNEHRRTISAVRSRLSRVLGTYPHGLIDEALDEMELSVSEAISE